MNKIGMAIVIILLLAGGVYLIVRDSDGPEIKQQETSNIQQESVKDEPAVKAIDFSEYNPKFKFSANIPESWEVEYVPQIESINIYDPESREESIRDKSQIFIRYFQASYFATLSTVNILERQEGKLNGHATVSYEIEKKTGIADFPHQPYWRNLRHKLTDIRLSTSSPSLFYVYSYNPELDRAEFEKFLNSLEFREN